MGMARVGSSYQEETVAVWSRLRVRRPGMDAGTRCIRQREAWDSELYFTVGISVHYLVACVLGFAEPDRLGRDCQADGVEPVQ